MKKIIIFIIAAIIFFSWLITNSTTKQEKGLPANSPLIIKSNKPGISRVSTITTAIDIKKCTCYSVNDTITLIILISEYSQ